MALLLCIDTASETATVGLCRGNEVVASVTSADQKNHAAFVQPAVQSVLQADAVSFADIDAVAVVNGPGSYTGLRVGLATAKGICYAAGKPLILLNTLEVMTAAAIDEWKEENALYCPLIDARRNEVFAAVYDFFFQPHLLPQPLIVDDSSFSFFLNQQKVYFFGSGHNKCKKLINHENAVFSNVSYFLCHINQLAQQCYILSQFADVAYAEPFYTKEFYLPIK